MIKAEYIIWSIEHQGWWASDGRGYVKERAKAGRYDFAQAIDIVSGANIGLHDVPSEAMVRLEAEEQIKP